jgi:hypothetical protein
VCTVNYIIFLIPTFVNLIQVSQQHVSVWAPVGITVLVSLVHLVLHDNSSLTQNSGMDRRHPMSGSTKLNLSYTDSKLHEIATLMANDSDFAVFRKFSELHFFNLLHIQHRLIRLEKDLCEKLQDRLGVTEIVVEIRQLLKDYSE